MSVKRFFDFTCALTGLLLLFPVLVLIYVLVRVKLGAPVIFAQERPGLGAKPFHMYKFRTMSDGRDKSGNLLPDNQRLTDFGALLRRTSLDELPELYNVLRGDMSLVGPRPLLTRYLPYYTIAERDRFSVLPGITGWAQINGRNELSWDERLRHDVWYVANRSLWLDLRILFLTVNKVFSAEGAVADPAAIMLNLDEERSGKI